MITILLLCLLLDNVFSSNITEGYNVTPVEEPSSITCYQCYIQTSTRGNDSKSETTLYHNTTAMLDQGTRVNSSQALHMCQKIRCTQACVIATDEVVIAADIAFPTPQPYYVTAANTTSANGTAKAQDKVKLEYRTCASPLFDMCDSFVELSSGNCKQEYCTSDNCNDSFSKSSLTQLIVIIVSATISLLVLIAIVLVILRWYLKNKNGNSYKQVASVETGTVEKKWSIRGSFWKKSHRVKKEVEKIEEKNKRSKESSTNNKDDPSKKKEDQTKKKEDQTKKKDDPSKKKDDPSKKKDDPSKKKPGSKAMEMLSIKKRRT